MLHIHWGKLRLVACGAALSTIGYRLLRSADAKKLYTFATAAVLREKEHIMAGITDIREDCEDIVADAKAINEDYAEERARIIEDHAERAAAQKEAAGAAVSEEEMEA